MFNSILDKQFPRLLSQACRDTNSPFYGCFDRNWWHYKIRDFASIMLQQGGYTLAEFAKIHSYHEYSEELKNLAWGSAIFWNKRVAKRGAFEEYYPWEQGYPPLAFSTLAVAKLAIEGIVEPYEIDTGLQKAVRQLQNRFEHQAGNQQVAGLAALAAIRKINPDLIDEKKYQHLKSKTLKLQNPEGWYTEYDGPDLGYLSVTLDCLWDLYDFTLDADYLNSAAKALEFLYEFVVRRNGGAGMHNARNTDYIVPYGICRFLDTTERRQEVMSKTILGTLYNNISNRKHFFHAIDDRYWTHYIGHSVARAQICLDKVKPDINKVVVPEIALTFSYPNAAYIFKQLNKEDFRILISAKKGGIFSIYRGNETLASDYGWIVETGKKQMVNHWWSDKWICNENDQSITIEGNLFPHSEKISKPILHIGLRITSFIFGSSLTRVLRNILIFKSKTGACKFKRIIVLDSDRVIVTDEIKGRGVPYKTTRAPRASKRHVASADSWHHEDFYKLSENGCKEKMMLAKDKITIETVFSLFELGKSIDRAKK